MWGKASLEALQDSLALYRPFFQHEIRLPGEQEVVLFQLSSSCHATSESTAFLVAGYRLWDAEILYRSVLEGTFRFAFLCCGNEAERDRRFMEFTEALPDVARLKRDDRARQVLSTREDPSTEEDRPYRDLLLSPAEAAELKEKYPSAERRTLNNRWGFVSIAEQLCKDDPPVKLANGMLHAFMMSSHAAHKDIESLRMVWDREGREKARKDALELAHAARVLQELIQFSILRASLAYRVKKISTEPLVAYANRHRDLTDTLDEAYQKWLDVEYSSTSTGESDES